MPPTKKLNLNIEVDILTAGSAADVVNTILEFLLYQRNQIPFVYKTYKYYIGKWSEEEITANGDCEDATQLGSTSALYSFQLERQREQARQTKDAISTMHKLISKAFDNNNVRNIRFLFGATTFTAKEAYTIHIPTEAISRSHSHKHHRIPHARLNQTLLALLTCEDLYDTFSHNLCPTNVYLELEMAHSPCIAKELHSDVQFVPKDICQLPPSCKDIHFHLCHTRPLSTNAMDLQCCTELQIFEDVMRLKLNDNETTHCQLDSKEKTATSTHVAAEWWEAEVVVRGFKEKPLKGRNLWSK